MAETSAESAAPKMLTLSDGRQLEWADNGVDSRHALVFHHATTIGQDIWQPWFRVAAERGVRAVSLNRPGVGSSTRNPGRRIIDDVADARQLIEHLEITKFVSVGWSGGGGRALGTTLIPGCVGVHSIAGIPWHAPDDELWLATVTPLRLERMNKYQNNWDAMIEARSATYEEDREITVERLLEILKVYLPHYAEFEAQYEDFAKYQTPAIRAAIAQGPEADGDDYQANIHPWGFEIDSITTPVTFWHGDLDDDVEMLYGEYNQSRIAGSKFVRLEGLGHVDIMLEARDRILSAALDSLLLS